MDLQASQPSTQIFRLHAWQRAVVVLLALVALVLIFGKGIASSLNHDEEQFVGPAAMVAQHGMLPYRDFPLFHMPNVTFAYALFYKLPMPFFWARLLNILCGFATVCIVFAYACGKLRAWTPGTRLAAAAGAAALLMFAPVFAAANGRTWNHDVPMLCSMAAIWMHITAARGGPRQWLWAAGSGFAFGLAAGTRLTYAPLAAPFVLSVAFFNGSWRHRFASLCAFSAATIIALLPSLYCIWAGPEQFYFGNFEYPRLRLLDPEDTLGRKTIKVWRKARYFFKEVVRSNPAVFLGFAFVTAPVFVSRLRRRAGRDFETLFYPLLLPFVFMGCFAPTRYQYQYYSFLAPVLVMAGIHALSALEWRRLRLVTRGFLIALPLAAVVLGADEYDGALMARDLDNWVPFKVRARGEAMRAVVGGGKILTLAPVYALEGGLDVYPEFSTGPFALRFAHFVAPERRQKLHMVAQEELDDFLKNDPPAAVILGLEPDKAEKPLKDYVKRHGYQRADWKQEAEIWLKPHAD
jgi:4-amino-4-deoxy-L-arabinose transferase-like glycosyltransferase